MIKIFLFKENHVKQIKLKKKTQTRRIHKKWRANIGAVHQVRTELFGKPHCYIRIIRRWEERLGDISIVDAYREGGYTVDEYIKGFIEMYDGNLDEDFIVKCYEFELVKGVK